MINYTKYMMFKKFKSLEINNNLKFKILMIINYNRLGKCLIINIKRKRINCKQCKI